MDKINPIYRKMIEQIALDNEDYIDEEMKPIYTFQKSKLDELHVLIGKLFIKYAVDGLLKLNSTQKASLNSEIKDKLKSMAKDLGQNEVDKISDVLSNVFEDSYYKNAYIMDSGLKIDLKFKILKQEFIDAAVKQEFKGELFSDRIWQNKADMIDRIQGSILECMKGNTTIDKIGRDIKDTFNVQAYESQRLVRTEMARVQTQASIDVAENTGVKEVMWSATLDNKTNPEDAALDGKRWGINEDYPTPPLHPNCRCVLINVPFSDWQPTKRKDNETKGIIDYTDYEQWKNDKNITE